MNEVEGKREPKVFVVEQQPFDYSSAKVYGEIIFMNAKKLAPWIEASGAANWNKQVIYTITKELSEYVPDFDYIIPTGAPPRMLLVGMILSTLGPSHKFLGWDSKTQRYLEYRLSLPQ